jgi:hypothetical protein
VGPRWGAPALSAGGGWGRALEEARWFNTSLRVAGRARGSGGVVLEANAAAFACLNASKHNDFYTCRFFRKSLLAKEYFTLRGRHEGRGGAS